MREEQNKREEKRLAFFWYNDFMDTEKEIEKAKRIKEKKRSKRDGVGFASGKSRKTRRAIF